TGARVGTPRYMSPEQIRGATVDARSDQWSFCAALYEGLYGESPYAGDRPESLFAEVLHGSLRSPPRAAPVPGWVRRGIAQGLATVAEERHPPMEQLLVALTQDPRARFRRLAGATAVATALGVAAVFVRQSAAGESSVLACNGVEQKAERA